VRFSLVFDQFGRPFVFLLAVADIPAGQACWLDYGDLYWENWKLDQAALSSAHAQFEGVSTSSLLLLSPTPRDSVVRLDDKDSDSSDDYESEVDCGGEASKPCAVSAVGSKRNERKRALAEKQARREAKRVEEEAEFLAKKAKKQRAVKEAATAKQELWQVKQEAKHESKLVEEAERKAQQLALKRAQDEARMALEVRQKNKSHLERVRLRKYQAAAAEKKRLADIESRRAAQVVCAAKLLQKQREKSVCDHTTLRIPPGHHRYAVKFGATTLGIKLVLPLPEESEVAKAPPTSFSTMPKASSAPPLDASRVPEHEPPHHSRVELNSSHQTDATEKGPVNNFSVTANPNLYAMDLPLVSSTLPGAITCVNGSGSMPLSQFRRTPSLGDKLETVAGVSVLKV
jgi:hypothetical protein